MLLFSHSFSRDAITPAQSLFDDEILVSANENFALGFFSPTHSTSRYIGIWYKKITLQTVVWVANRRSPIKSSTASLLITSNGTLIIRDYNYSTVIWSSPSQIAMINPVAQLLDNGNFVVRDADSNNFSESIFAWQSFDHPTDTLLLGMKLGYDLRTGLNRNLTASKIGTNPSPIDMCISLDIQGVPQLVVSYGSVQKWRSGPWNGFEFNGLPEMESYNTNGFSFYFVNDKNEVYYTYNMANRSILTRLVANQTGQLQWWVWLDSSETWSLYWSVASDECEYSRCGPYSACDENASPICSSLQGFVPKKTTDWNLGDWSAGCVRNQSLDCVNGTDGFAKMTNVMLLDTTNATMNMTISLDECWAKCLMNCSCTGYANADVLGRGSECIIWITELVDLELLWGEDSGQDFYVRLTAKDLVLPSTKSKSHRIGPKIGTVTVSTVLGSLLLFLICYCIWMRRKRTKDYFSSTDHHRGEGNGGDKELEVPLINFSTLMAATNNFSTENMLGKGGFGPVYKGKLVRDKKLLLKGFPKLLDKALMSLKMRLC